MKVLIVMPCLLAIALAGYAEHHHYPQHIPVIGHNGVPLEPAEVVHARQSHLAIVAAAKTHHGSGGYDGGYGGHYGGDYGGGYAGGYGGAGHHYNIHSYPVIGHDGQPQETPEVVALKHAHFAAHAEAKARLASHGGGYGGYDDGSYGGSYGGGYASGYSGLGHTSGYKSSVVHVAPAHHAGYHGGYHGGYHIPIIGHNGVPLDTPEVAHAKKQHYAAHAEASARSHGYGHHY